MRKLVVSAVTVAVLLCVGVSPLLAMGPVTYGPVTMDHNKYGVSQFLAGLGTGYAEKQKIYNPSPVEMIALIISYDRPSDVGASDGIFADCAVVSIKPHGVNTTAVTYPALMEVIAAPLDPVMVDGQMTRMADGLGVLVNMGPYGGDRLQLMNPMHFVIPNKDDLKAAQTCMNQGLKAIGAPTNTFAEFVR